ncbi:MAG: M20/M25/M40 family metallo-hydrolase [Nibricoccus sp.]
MKNDGIPATCEALLSRMVAYNTVNTRYGGAKNGEAELASYLERLAEGWGLGVRRYPLGEGAFNLFVFAEVSPGGEWLLFDSHLDTVGGGGASGPVVEAAIRQGEIHGRGTCDTKGSGAAMLWALRLAVRLGELTRNVGIFFTVDEEAGMTGAMHVAREVLPGWGAPIRGIFVGEPTELTPLVAHNGVVRWTVVTHGRAAHSSDPTAGKSAISAMLRVVDAFEREYVPTASRTHPLTGAAAASVNVIRGGTQVNIIPDRCEIEIDRRLVPGETAGDALAKWDEIVRGVVARHPDVEVAYSGPAYVVPPLEDGLNAGFYAWMKPVLLAAGMDAEKRGARYVTNASHYAAAGVPTIVFGPGDIAQAHTEDEWLALDQLENAAGLYFELMHT